MSISIPFQVIDWAQIEATTAEGSLGESTSKTLQFPGLRIRIVAYGPGYLADHWCQRGHIVHCLEGSFVTELGSGEKQRLVAGMSYVVSDDMSSHRSQSDTGVKLLIVDGEFLAFGK